MKFNFVNFLKAALLPLLTLVFFLAACTGLFDWKQDAHAASFSKPLYCGVSPNTTFFPVGPQPPTIQIAVPELQITKLRSNLTVVVHGWRGNPGEDLEAIKNLTKVKNSSFDTASYDWRPLSDIEYSGIPPVRGQATRTGDCLGYDIVNKGYTYVHLIGHSLGATVIDSASRIIKQLAPNTTVVLTGLDAYKAVTPLDFGSAANFADQYFATGGISGPATDWAFANACNVDVTNPGLIYSGDQHGWPIQFYLQSISNPQVFWNSGYGFSLHKEARASVVGANCPRGSLIQLQPCFTADCFPNTANCTLPVLTAPVAGSTFPLGAGVTFTWTTTCPTSILEISYVNGSSTSKSTITTSAKQYYKSLNTGAYSIRVQGKDSTGKLTPWSSSVGSIIVGAPSGGTSCNTPTVTQPTNGGNFASGGPVTIKWNTGCPSSYFEITGGPYTSPQTAGWVAAKEYTYQQGLHLGSYTLKVRGKNSSGSLTSWSTNVTFTVGGSGPTNPTPNPTCSGNAVITDTANKCVGVSNSNCNSLSSLGLGSLKSVAPNSGWSVVVSSQTGCGDEIGRYQQSATVDSGVSAGAKAIRLEAVLPTDCPSLPPTGGIKAYRDLNYSENGGCRILTLANGGIPYFPAVGYPSGPRSLKFFGDHIDRARVTMYEGENYTGTSCTSYTQDMSDFLQCANEAISMKVEPFTASTKAQNIASLGQWDRDMSAALDTNPTTWSPVPTGTNVGVVYSTNKLISGLTIHDRPNTPDTNGIGTIFVGFGGGTSGGVFTENLGLVSAGQRCITYIPATPIDARWVNIKLIDSSGSTGLSDVEIFTSPGEIRPTINCPAVNTTALRLGETAPPANWVAPVSATLQTPNCDSKTLFLYKSNGSSFSDLCPNGGTVSGATSTNPCGTFTHFGGSNIVTLPDSPLLNRNAMEVTMCVKVDNQHGHPMTLIRREMQNGGTADQFNLAVGEKITGGAYCASGHLGTTATVPTGWHVLGIRFDSPNGAITLSIDGVVVESIPARSDSGTCPTWNSGYGPLVLGNNRANSDYLIGDIAWVKVATP